jgi:DNA-binding beta-propeller fold protein YncE
VLSSDGATLYVSDCGNDRVYVLRSADGAHVRTIECREGGVRTPGAGRTPSGLALSADGDTLFVVQTNAHRVSVFETRTGRHLRSWGKRGCGPGEFLYPTYCSLSRNGGVLFVTDTGNHRVVACDAATGALLWCFGREGSADGQLSSPLGLALSRCGRDLFVADSANGRVVVLASADGSARRSWAVAGRLVGIGLGPDGRLFVASVGSSNRLRKFS